MIDRAGGVGSLCRVGDPATSRRTRRRRSRRPFLLTALALCSAVAIGSCAVLWLAVHVLTDVSDDGLPLADGVELLKVALAAGLSKWAAAAQAA
jgi:hypothetical protein